MATALPPVDSTQVEAFWARAVRSGAVEASTPMPTSVEPFGDSAELADELLELVVNGPKRATAGAVADYEHDDAPIPAVGDMWVVTDGRGQARALLRATDVRVGPLSSVDESFAWDEGEGDRTRESWLRDHEAFFRRYLPRIGLTFEPDMPTVFERFEVVYSE